MKYLISFGCLLGIVLMSCRLESPVNAPQKIFIRTAVDHTTAFLQQEDAVADSLYHILPPGQVEGQLLIQDAGANAAQVGQWLSSGIIGGTFLGKLSPADIAGFRTMGQLPLWIGTNETVNLYNQFNPDAPFPKAASLAGLGFDSIYASLIDQFAMQCRRLGVNLVEAPAIGFSGQQGGGLLPESRVYERWLQPWIKTMLEHQVLISGQGLPWAETNLLDTVSWQPALHQAATRLTGMGLPAWTAAQARYIDSSAAYFSQALSNHLHFEGLVVVRVNGPAGAATALNGGADLLIAQDSVPAVHQYLRKWATIHAAELSDKVKRVLLAKHWTQQAPPLPQTPERLPMMKASLLPALKEVPETVTTTLGDYFSDARFRRQAADLYEQSLVLAKDPQRKLPFQQVKNRHFEVIPVSGKPFSEFKSYFGKFADSHWSGDLLERDGNIAELKTALLSKNTVIVLLDVPVIDPLQHRSFLTSLESLSQKTDVVAVHFGRPDQLLQLPSGVIQVHAYERNKWTENLAAQLLFGAIAPRGVLDPPLPGYPKQLAGWEPIRMKFAQPEEAGIAAEKLVGLDAIAANAVADGVTPGCQIAVVKSGKLIYSKAFGHHSNAAAAPPVQTDDLYDLASITKVAATTLAAMKLYENDQLNLTQRLRKYVEIEGYSQVGLITIHKLMTHQSGLQPHLPIFKYIFPKELEGQANPYFTTTPQPGFSRQVAGHLYFKDVCWDSIRQEIFSLRLPSRARYRYSDLNFWLLQQVVENISGQPLDQYVSQNIYEPLGLRHMTFQPAGKFPMAQIVPTQYDEKWRGQLVQGYVHDEVAALMGGVSGNAGLFSNAEDLAVLFQMLVNGGVYGGMRLFEPETVQLFTSTKYSKNRGLGFDKPRGSDDNSAYAAGAPAAAFGHTGFTGTCVWADPQNELVFVFLANRICPDVKNRRLFEQKTRHRLHQVVYDAIGTLPPGLPELTEVE